MEAIEDVIELSIEYKNKLENVREVVRKIWKTHRSINPPFTDHGELHSKILEKNLYELFQLDNTYRRDNFLNTFTDSEKFILFASVWLHDVGMSPTLLLPGDIEEKNNFLQLKDAELKWAYHIRNEHHIRSARYIRLPIFSQLPDNLNGLKKELETLNCYLTDQEYDYLSTICFYHRRSETIPYQYDKIRIMIAFLRMADALHIPERNTQIAFQNFIKDEMDPISKSHWFKSFFVSYAGPSKSEPWKIIIKFKKPKIRAGEPELSMSALEHIMISDLYDELDAVKDILISGNNKYGLPAYSEIEGYFDEIFLENSEINDLKELLGVIELYYPAISPNAGKLIDTVINQIMRIIDIKSMDLKDVSQATESLNKFIRDTLKPLIEDKRPCHGYLHNIYAFLSYALDNSPPKIIENYDKCSKDKKSLITDGWLKIIYSSIKCIIEYEYIRVILIPNWQKIDYELVMK